MRRRCPRHLRTEDELQNPPKIYTEIAIEQMDGNRGFFETPWRRPFNVTDKALLAEFKQTNDAYRGAD